MDRDERFGPGPAVVGSGPEEGISCAVPDPQSPPLAAPRSGNAGVPAGGPAKPRRGAATSRPAWAHQRSRIMPALPPPTEAEVRRMVAEFEARGGRVTICRPMHLLPVHNGAGRDAKRWTA